MSSEFSERRFTTGDGLSLYARDYGSGDKVIVCLAGLTRNSRDFHAVSVLLSRAGFRVITIDSRGRGQSDHARDIAEYNVLTEAEDVIAGLAALGIAHAGFIGTSRGGLILHVLAAMRPALLRAIVLNDIGPVVEMDGLMQIRRYLHNAPRPKSWPDAVDLQKSVHGKAFPALTDADWERHARAVYREDGKGNIVSDCDPRIGDTLKSLDPDTPLPALWPQFEGFAALPLMVIRGENSRLLSEKTFAEMGVRHPGAELVTARDQGHAPHLDTTDLPARLATFFAKALK